MAPHLSHDEFFTSLTTLLSSTSQKARGSVFLSQKPLLETPSSSKDDSPAPTRPSILIRATDGNTNAPNPKSYKDKKKAASKKVKLSTVVAFEDLEAFYTRYADVCKGGMTGLKKRDRKKGKAKAKGGAAKVIKA
ncbi:hypothetical protein ASPWEDRAFT_29042 [Aspergillus wentii DTO 134E9]|uniref:Signal recognition particle subunit SRP14 n=1 Tax=Aspergillus wentii DTO 134E9 TaxID=1073089 RepID=A0A1L9RG18_ASPWE|nr:uncharacterized protein ASPWEDRAFT_29042 [Aspergillus wentii DTO 134E9]KAI9925605.1 hypothetical protein MW887_005987 [Aspergillus wentii]OJJ33844.1 hypothetical protein ASPWEDRAFT_29042 [Aspergillus wentii DTO 134E9]